MQNLLFMIKVLLLANVIIASEPWSSHYGESMESDHRPTNSCNLCGVNKRKLNSLEEQVNSLEKEVNALENLYQQSKYKPSNNEKIEHEEDLREIIRDSIVSDSENDNSAEVAAKVSTTTSKEIIPRSVLFGNPMYASLGLSPDGKYLAYLAPSSEDLGGYLNIYVRETFDKTSSRMITKDVSRGIREFYWAEDSETILYMQDHKGDENFHLWVIDATTKDAVARDLTPGDNVKASSIFMSKYFPYQLMVETNQRNSSIFDVYRCTNYTDPNAELIMDTKNPGDVIGWGTEERSFEIRVAIARNPKDASTTINVRDDSESEWRDLFHFPFGEEGTFIDFYQDDYCWITSSIGRDTTALLKVDLRTGNTVNVMSHNEKSDINEVIMDPDTHDIRAVFYNYARIEHVFFDEEEKRDYDLLRKKERALHQIFFGDNNNDADILVSSKTRDENLWSVAFKYSDKPIHYFLYDRKEEKLTPLFVSNSKLSHYKFSKMEDVRIKARDGLELVAYLTRAKLDEKTPLILYVHGGPWSRDNYGFNPTAQLFANRGYATLQVNYRGSTGFGKTFLHKGDKEWGVGNMQHDLTDSVRWAIDNNIADPENICIYGGSYGGYAALAGLVFTPDIYKCGIDVVGPSNLRTLFDSFPSYWGPSKKDLLNKIGDVYDDEFNKKISPLFHVDNIHAPLLIGQGANDPRVKKAESDQIAFSMKEKGIPVEYILYPDEGHGFKRPDNLIDFYGRMELFLQKHLGGRAEEFEKPEGSTAQFPLLQSHSGNTIFHFAVFAAITLLSLAFILIYIRSTINEFQEEVIKL